LGASMRRHEGRQLGRIDWCILPKLDTDQVTFSFDSGHARLYRPQAQRCVLHQLLYRDRRFAVAITKFGFDIRELLLSFNARNPLVQAQALIFFRNITRRDANVEPEIELRLRSRLDFAFHFTDRLFQHLRI